jgi:hypothetical protein
MKDHPAGLPLDIIDTSFVLDFQPDALRPDLPANAASAAHAVFGSKRHSLTGLRLFVGEQQSKT